MTRTQSTVVAVFKNRTDAQAAVDDLKTRGFDSEDIFLSSEGQNVYDTTQSSDEDTRHHEGGIKGWFKSVFGQEDDADRPYYEEAVSSGNVFVSVEAADDKIDAAADVLNRHNPIDVRSEGGRVEDTTASDTRTSTGATSSRKSPAPAATSTTDADQTKAIPVVKEELQIGKRTVLRGGVRVYSRVIEEPVEENINLRQEHVRVERNAANRPTTDADLQRGKEQVIEVKEYAEEPVVSKQSRVVEEVRVRKDAEERTEKVRDTVRHTEVRVENLSDEKNARSATQTTGTAAGIGDADYRRHYAETYGASGQDYETYAPAYEYGYTMARDPRYEGRSFSEVESDLRQDYARRYPNSTWDRVKAAVENGWQKITGKA